MCDFMKICKRENNTKRNYLVLNTKQCKHYPSSPKEALFQFQKLASEIRLNDTDKVLCIGFAETATAIGVEVANYLNTCTGRVDYIQTTREASITEYYEFSEEHSHATEQKLALDDFDIYDRIIFIEDEVTTGNTILNIINVLIKHYPDIKFSVASILNGMTDEQMSDYNAKGIDVYYLHKIDNTSFSSMANSTESNGVLDTSDDYASDDMHITRLYSNLDTRHITDLKKYNQELRCIEYFIENDLRNTVSPRSRVCIVGTEEFMYPAIKVGEHLQRVGYDVVSHSTTRSPIEVSNDNGYPLNIRVSLPSVYDRDRDTFIYNVDKYDIVVILTESTTKGKGLGCLVNAFKEARNDVIKVYKIGDFNDAVWL